MGREPEDKPRIAAWFDEQYEFWSGQRNAARRPWSRWFARGMARWAGGGAAFYRQRIAEEEREAKGASDPAA